MGLEDIQRTDYGHSWNGERLLKMARCRTVLALVTYDVLNRESHAEFRDEPQLFSDTNTGRQEPPAPW